MNNSTIIIKDALSRELVGDIAGALKSGNAVKVTGLGVFSIKKMKSRMGWNPRTKKAMKIAARTRVRFRLSSMFSKEVL